MSGATDFQRVSHWLHACGKEQDHIGHFTTQVGVDLEETLEALACIETTLEADEADTLGAAIHVLKLFAEVLKRGEVMVRIAQGKRAEFLDGLCDRYVTGAGLAYLAKMNLDGAMEEVLKSNESKLGADGKPVILEGGKIGKSSGYIPPNLTPFV